MHVIFDAQLGNWHFAPSDYSLENCFLLPLIFFIYLDHALAPPEVPSLIFFLFKAASLTSLDQKKSINYIDKSSERAGGTQIVPHARSGMRRVLSGQRNRSAPDP